jgi:exodeoxyribonuclease V alpha subunit
VSSIIELCKDRLPAFYGYSSVQNIQVLTPMRKSPVGVMHLNTELQKVLNPPSKQKKEKTFRDIIYREGDKVMQIKNNYNIKWEKISDGEEGMGIFNGDVGYIEKINHEDSTMTIIFDDDKKVEYDFNQLDELELAYAITVHKSQGSEFPVVVMPMFPGAPMLMSRNLFYTAVTRARELVVLVGKENIIRAMVDNNRETKRYSGLKEKLKKMLINKNLLTVHSSQYK